MSSDLANVQINILAQFVADNNYLEELIAENATINQSLLISLQREAEGLMATARSNHSALLNTKKPSEAVTKYMHDDVFTNIRRKFHIYWSTIEDKMIKEPKPEGFNSTLLQETLSGARNCNAKLNKLTLPTFSGDIRNWKSFHNSFMSLVGGNTSYSLLDKMRYLVDSLTHDAKSLVNHLPLVDENYEAAMNLLIARYDHKRVLVNVYLNTLYNLETMKKESAVNIRKTIDIVRECYQALKCVGIDIDSWSPMIIFLVQTKLSPHLNQLWEEKLNNSKELPTFQQFEEFLECRFRTLDIITPRSSTTISSVFHVQNNSSPTCQLCDQAHFISSCRKFRDATPTERYKLVIQNKLCINCLSNGHMLNDCSSKHSCRECQRRHHSFLHKDSKNNSNKNKNSNNNFQDRRNKQKSKDKKSRNSASNTSQNTSQVYTTQVHPGNPQTQSNLDSNSQPFQPQTSVTLSHHINSLSKNTYLLGTAVVQLSNGQGRSRVVRALLDPGSEDNYITDSIVNGLSLRKYYSPSAISVIGGQLVEGITHRCDFTLRSLHNEFEIKIDAGIKGSITPDLPKEPIPGLSYNFLNNLKLADASFDEPGQIDLLLGMGVWVQIVQNGLVKNELMMAQKTALGWLVQGMTGKPSTYQSKPSRCFNTLGLENQIQKFWELERVGNGKAIETPENVLCEQIVLNSIKQLEDKKLSVDLPFKNNTLPILGKSREIAKNRFFNLEKRLNQNAKLREEYHKTIREYLDCGHMIPISEIDCKGKEYYLPHHAVLKESSTTTKVRVVFDASCKTSDHTSLNDHLLTGEKLQVDIRDILLRWRQYPIVYSADVEKMYRQFWVNDQFHDYQKILWRFSNSEPVQTYVLTTVTFGTSAAPFLALRLLKYIANSDLAKQFPLASKAINDDFYVDDLMSGSYSCEEAVASQQQIRELLTQFGLSIRKWCSSDLSALKTIPDELCEISEHTFDETDYKKTLGVYWSPSFDSFAFSVEKHDLPNLKLTKRKTLSLIARLYDPLGWVGPCTTFAKIIMQKVWKSSVGWDDIIPDDIQSQFRFFLEDLQKLNELSIPRWIKLTSSNEPMTLLGFADASEVGFGCVIYLSKLGNNGENILLTSRSRVAPLNFTTVARLELCAALLLAEVLEWCESLFSGRKITVHAFSDSKIVLSWLQSHPSRWKTFVANRTSEILQRYDRSHWHYINTKENPADCISRGLLPSELLENELWWKGPKNLSLDEPFSLESEQEKKILSHETKISQTCLTIQSHDPTLFSYFSSNRKLFKRISTITTFLMKCLLRCCRKNQQKQQRYLELIQRIQNPEHIVFRVIQSEHFGKEIRSLRNNESLDRKSKLRTLSPFIDGFGILRVGSRLENSEILTYDQKFPIIIPSYHQVTINLISEAHAATMHGSFKLTFAYIRTRFHIMKGKDRINFFLRRCMVCLRFAKSQQNQLMGSLPYPRVNQFKPFLFSGVDFAGPMLIRNTFTKGSKTTKVYIAIFICLCTKAIHIELVSDLTSESFLASLRRFVYRRGKCKIMHSDCGTNFKGASKILYNECHEAQVTWKSELQPDLTKLGILWEFNPPSSPHFGGLWEAGVKSIKTHLNKTLKDSILTFEGYYTVLVQIEGILNSRPLCPISENPDSYEILTPAHFLVGEPIVAPPEPKYEIKQIPISARRRWKHVQQLQQQFWVQWRQTYLHTLAKRPKWLDSTRNFQIGDLVLITENNVAPTIWPRARIIETHPGQDGLVRVVTLQTAERKVFKRPVTKIRFLPVNPQEGFYGQNVDDPP